ncbi:MAG: hypothetical protein C0502_01195 [Opitutus sp.]|nr:hypothetical protein [Opitutus sp.]
MSGSYHIFLLHLKPKLAGFSGSQDRVDHGRAEVEEICRLADQLLALARTEKGDPQAGLLIQRGESKWRLVVHEDRLRLHKSSSLFDEFWAANRGEELAHLPPFRQQLAPAEGRTVEVIRLDPTRSTTRTVLGLVGLGALALGLMAFALRFGLPQRRLSDLPAGVTIVSSPAERQEIFRTVAGAYSTGSTPGNSIVTITPEGEVTLASIGKDGKPTAPRVREVARAGRKAGQAIVITSFGIIAATEPPKAVNVGAYPWKASPS